MPDLAPPPGMHIMAIPSCTPRRPAAAPAWPRTHMPLPVVPREHTQDVRPLRTMPACQ